MKEITKSHEHILSIYQESINRNLAYLSRPDSLIDVNITVNCRAKNAMGALILNTINLKLDPKDNKLSIVTK